MAKIWIATLSTRMLVLVFLQRPHLQLDLLELRGIRQEILPTVYADNFGDDDDAIDNNKDDNQDGIDRLDSFTQLNPVLPVYPQEQGPTYLSFSLVG